MSNIKGVAWIEWSRYVYSIILVLILVIIMLIHSAGNIAFLDNYLYIIIWLVLEGIDCLSREIL